MLISLTVVLKLPLDSLFDEESPFLSFFGAVVIAAWLGSLAPRLLTTVLVALTSGYFLFVPDLFAPD